MSPEAALSEVDEILHRCPRCGAFRELVRLYSFAFRPCHRCNLYTVTRTGIDAGDAEGELPWLAIYRPVPE